MDPRLFRGWWVVAAAFAVLFLSYGLQFSYGVFVSGMAADLGWTRAQTALPYSIYVFVYSALSAATGRATDRFGPRPVIATGAVLLGIGWGTSALVARAWQLDITLGIVAALGMSVAWVPCNATVSRWFTRRRGTAVAIASTGGSVGNLVVPPIAAAFITWCGWRSTLAGLAVLSAALMLVAARYMIRDPESLGLWPDGEPEAENVTIAPPGRRLEEVWGTAPFLLVVAIYLLTWVSVFVPFVHGAAYAEDLHVGKLAAASVIGVIGIGGIVGRLFSGVLSDRIGRLPSLLAVFALQIVAFVAFAAAGGIAALWFAAVTFGFSYGGGVTLLPALCGDLFGRAHVAAIVGMIFAVAGAPAAIGPYLAGWLHDVTRSYGAAFLCAAALNAGSLALTWVLMRSSLADR